MPNGRGVVVSGHEPGHGSRLYVVDLATGTARAASPEGIGIYNWQGVAPDGRAVVALAADGTPTLYPLEGGDPRPVPGAVLGDVPIRWSADGGSLYVQRGVGVPAHVDLLNVTTGARRPWTEFSPPDLVGITQLGPILMTGDGRAYVYSYRRILDDLFVVRGLR
jgi:hypothetical protein